MQRSGQIPPWGERPKSRHLISWSLALLLSLALHALTVQRIPPLALGRMPAIEERPRRSAMVLEDIRPAWTLVPDEPVLLDATHSDASIRDAVDGVSFQGLLESILPASQTEMSLALPGMERAIQPPEPATDRQVWEARQDIVHIKDRVVPDEVSALPRKLIADIEYIPSAPDISPPVDMPGLQVASRGDQWRQAIAGAQIARAPDGPPVWALEESLPEEDASAITDVAAIEDLLALNVSAYQADDGIYFRILITRSGAEALPVLPKDVLLIQDASASMTQAKLDIAKQGLHAWLGRLREGDRLNVIAFRDEAEYAFQEWREWSPITRTRAAFFVESMSARGGTDIFSSLQPLFSSVTTPERPVISVIISDGIPTVGIVDSTEIIARFSAANEGDVSVFSVGGGPRVNMYLLDFLSFKNRGDAILPLHGNEISSALDQLSVELSRPVLTQLHWRLAGAKGVELFPHQPTHLFLDRPLELYGRAPLDVDTVVLRVAGRSGKQVKDMVFRLDTDAFEPGGTDIRSGWAWQKVYHLIGEHIRTRKEGLLDEIQRMAIRYDVPLQYGARRTPDIQDRRIYFHGMRAGSQSTIE